MQLHADGYVAEIATPPVRAGRDAARALAAWAALGAAELRRAIPAGLALRGESTHLNISIDGARGDRLALLYAQTFAPALMLLTDRPVSPGLLVRPRPGRLELCAEFVDGRSLEAATLFALGSTIATTRALARNDRSSLPPALDCVLEPARLRHGWYVDRRAFGDDLYDAGRDTVLTTVDGTMLRAGEHLVAAWRAARPHVTSLATPAEVALVDAIVDGRSPLPIEGPLADPATGAVTPSPYRGLVRPRRCGATLVEPVVGTWDFTAFRVADGGREAVLCVPGRDLERFLDALDRGRLDAELARALAAADAAPVLRSWEQTGTTAFFRAVDVGPTLVPTDYMGVGDGPIEPVPTRGRVMALSPLAAAPVATRPTKPVPPLVAVRTPVPWWAWLAVAVVPLLVFATTFAALDGRTADQRPAVAITTTTTTATPPTTTTTTPSTPATTTTTATPVAAAPTLVGACIGVDHSPPYTDPGTGAPVEGASVLLWAASYGGVAPGSRLTIPMTGPGGPFVLDAGFDDTGRVTGAHGIFSFGTYEPTGAAVLRRTDSNDLVTLDPPFGAITVGPAEVPCSAGDLAVAQTTTTTVATTTTSTSTTTTTTIAASAPTTAPVAIATDDGGDDGDGGTWWPLIPLGLLVAAGGVALLTRRDATVLVPAPTLEKGNAAQG